MVTIHGSQARALLFIETVKQFMEDLFDGLNDDDETVEKNIERNKLNKKKLNLYQTKRRSRLC